LLWAQFEIEPIFSKKKKKSNTKSPTNYQSATQSQYIGTENKDQIHHTNSNSYSAPPRKKGSRNTFQAKEQAYLSKHGMELHRPALLTLYPLLSVGRCDATETNTHPKSSLSPRGIPRPCESAPEPAALSCPSFLLPFGEEGRGGKESEAFLLPRLASLTNPDRLAHLCLCFSFFQTVRFGLYGLDYKL